MDHSQATESILALGEPGVEVGKDGAKFRLQNRFLLLTYKTHIPKEGYIEWINEKIDTIEWIRLAHETGDKTVPYEHTHVLVDLGRNFQTTNCRYFDYESGITDEDGVLDTIIIHPHIRKLIGKKPFEDAKKYIAKEDPENLDLLPKPNWVLGVMACKTTKEALIKYAGKPGDVTGIIATHGIGENDYRRRTRKEFIPRDWQQKMHDELQYEPDDRKIEWIYDPEGASGKTAFGKWMEDMYPNDFIFCTDLGTTRDAATIISNALQGGWNCKGIFINLSRTSEDHDRMYSYIEEIKDGRVTTQKYNGRMIRFDSPHVVVFANYMPKTGNLSADRWKIRKISFKDDNYQLSGPMRRIIVKRKADNGFRSSVPVQRDYEED